MQQIEVLLQELMEHQIPLYEKVCMENYTDVCYQEKKDATWGISDQNYINRLKLANYLFYEHKGEEKLIVTLFEEELKDRETNSFQGIGDTLELLTVLLRAYNNDGKYDRLFKRAKNANFDCACGYSRDKQIESDIGKSDIHDALYLAITMNELEIARKLLQIWKSNVDEWDSIQLSRLIRYNEDVGWEEQNGVLLEKYLRMMKEKGKNQEIIAAWKDLIAYDVKFKKWEKAYQENANLRMYAGLEEVCHLRLFLNILELSMEIICNYPEKAQELWKWCKPRLKEKDTDLYGNLYEKAVCAAKKVGDVYAAELEEKHQQWHDRMYRV